VIRLDYILTCVINPHMFPAIHNLLQVKMLCLAGELESLKAASNVSKKASAT